MERKNLKRISGVCLSLLASARFALLPLFTLPLIRRGIGVPSMSSILGVTEPLTAVVIGVTVFGENLTLQIIGGVFLIILSVVSAIAGPRLIKGG